MALHLLKLCVGVERIEDLARWQAGRRRRGVDWSPHYTRNLPRRAAEILDGGSLYWVIKGLVRVRQRIILIDSVELEDGRYCRLGLHRDLVRTELQPRKPHQGWRYLEPADAPPDLAAGADPAGGELPPELAAELRSLGLL